MDHLNAHTLTQKHTRTRSCLPPQSWPRETAPSNLLCDEAANDDVSAAAKSSTDVLACLSACPPRPLLRCGRGQGPKAVEEAPALLPTLAPDYDEEETLHQ